MIVVACSKKDCKVPAVYEVNQKWLVCPVHVSEVVAIARALSKATGQARLLHVRRVQSL